MSINRVIFCNERIISSMNKIKENIIRYENLYNILVILSVATFNLAVTTIYRNSYFNILMQVILVIIILAYLLFSKHLLLNIVKMGNKSKLKDNIYYLLTIFLSFESSKIIVTNMSKGYVDRGSILINVAKKVASVLHTSVGRLLCLEKIACFFIMMPFLIMIWLVVLNYVIPIIHNES